MTSMTLNGALRRCVLPLLALALAHTASAQDAAAPSPARAEFNTCTKPVWPQKSLRYEEQGTVTLGFLIAADGRVSESKIIKSSGFPLLDISAKDAIALCKFKPALQDGKPVQAWMQMQYVWTLEDSAAPTPDQLRELQAGAERGDTEAEVVLAKLYMVDDKTKKNLPEARRLLRNAAAKNHAGAQYSLGLMATGAFDSPVDLAKAVKLFRQAAEQGHKEAQHMLGMFLLNGRGVSKDADGAMMWFRKAAAQGHMGSAGRLGSMLAAKERSPDDIAEGIALLRRGAAAYDAHAQYALGHCYEIGLGVGQDAAQAMALYKLAALAGHPAARQAVAEMTKP